MIERLTTKGTIIMNREGTEAGRCTGGARICAIDGKERPAVRWPDGELTYPCLGGMIINAAGTYQIAS